MAKRIVFDTTDAKAFTTAFNPLTHRYGAWEVWCDFITMLASFCYFTCADLATETSQKRAEQLIQTMQKYQQDELEQFTKMADILRQALEQNPEQDFLGQLYMSLDFGSSWHGQYFTPWNVAKGMAEMIADGHEEIGKERFISVGDFSCGAGCPLIAITAIYDGQENRHDYRDTLLFVGQDLDRIVALMCYIQLSFLDCAGYVVIGNSLSNPVKGSLLFPQIEEGEELWFTPMWYSPIWSFRRAMETVEQEMNEGARK